MFPAAVTAWPAAGQQCADSYIPGGVSLFNAHVAPFHDQVSLRSM
jgi:hypothetical protein